MKCKELQDYKTIVLLYSLEGTFPYTLRFFVPRWLVTHIDNHKERDEEEEPTVGPSPHPLPCHLHGMGLPQSNKTVHEPLLVQELQQHHEACMGR